MPILEISQLDKILSENPELKKGCIIDTNLIFGASFGDDIHHSSAIKLLKILMSHQVPLWTNVNVRAEFIHLCLRIVLPQALKDIFDDLGNDLPETVFKKLKSIKTRVDKARLEERLFKIQNKELGEVRSLLESYPVENNNTLWDWFCEDYFQGVVAAEWTWVEKELGINFLSLRFEKDSGHLREPLTWDDAISIIEKTAIGSADAMIVNLFEKSNYNLIASLDSDIAFAVEKVSGQRKFVVTSH